MALNSWWPALVVAAGLFSTAARADVVYSVHVDTSAVNTTTGWIDIQFNPGSNSWQDAFATLTGFSTDGALLPSPSLTPDVSGALPGSVTLHNVDAFNDYFQQATFGNAFSFFLTLSGAAINTPDSNVFSGTSFSVSLYANDQSTPLLAPAALFQIDIGPGSPLSVTNNLVKSVTVQQLGTDAPEPASFALFAGAMAAVAGIRIRRQSKP